MELYYAKAAALVGRFTSDPDRICLHHSRQRVFDLCSEITFRVEFAQTIDGSKIMDLATCHQTLRPLQLIS